MSETGQRPNAPAPVQVPPEIRGAPRIAIATGESGDIVPSGTPQLEDGHRSFAEFHQGYVSSYIALADTKASWLFAIAAGVLVYLFSTDEIREILLLAGWTLPFVVAAATMVLLILTAAFAFLVISPRLGPPGEGIVFFRSVARKSSADSFVREIASLSDAALTEARLRHCYDISRVCAQKYRYLRRAFWSGMLALVGTAWIVLLT